MKIMNGDDDSDLASDPAAQPAEPQPAEPQPPAEPPVPEGEVEMTEPQPSSSASCLTGYFFFHKVVST